MTLKEIRKIAAITKSLPDDTPLHINFCGYISDNDRLEEVRWSFDGDTEFVDVLICGKPYEDE